jgi:hypothetical protein
MARLRREIEVDLARAVGDRVPIVTESRAGFEFNEPAVAVNLDPPRSGVIGWDPVLGWVLVMDRSGRPASQPGPATGRGW